MSLVSAIEINFPYSLKLHEENSVLYENYNEFSYFKSTLNQIWFRNGPKLSLGQYPIDIDTWVQICMYLVLI